jgi:hypothetical protein
MDHHQNFQSKPRFPLSGIETGTFLHCVVARPGKLAKAIYDSLADNDTGKGKAYFLFAL